MHKESLQPISALCYLHAVLNSKLQLRVHPVFNQRKSYTQYMSPVFEAVLTFVVIRTQHPRSVDSFYHNHQFMLQLGYWKVYTSGRWRPATPTIWRAHVRHVTATMIERAVAKIARSEHLVLVLLISECCLHEHGFMIASYKENYGVWRPIQCLQQ